MIEVNENWGNYRIIQNIGIKKKQDKYLEKEMIRYIYIFLTTLWSAIDCPSLLSPAPLLLQCCTHAHTHRRLPVQHIINMQYSQSYIHSPLAVFFYFLKKIFMPTMHLVTAIKRFTRITTILARSTANVVHSRESVTLYLLHGLGVK